ncbi:MAG: phosphoserine phosphatase SerB [Alphaproteobacteria bacterium]|nr:phosphoserine phosphatase SerB [Alphaproteobacteria bacterium]
MRQILTLTGAPNARDVTDNLVARAAEILTRAGAAVGTVDPLAPGVAVDLPYDGIEPARATRAVRDGLPRALVDVNAQPAEGRRKRLLIADMDSTLIVGETLDELAEHAGIKKKIAAITARAMRGELDFEDALKARVRMLKGLTDSAIDAVVAGLTLTDGAEALVATMKANGAYCAVVSGGFEPMTRAIRDRLGCDEDRSNRLEIADGALTGRVIPPILGRDAKLSALQELAATLDIDTAAAVGDGANDLAMLGAAGLGVAFRAKPAVKEAASFRIDHADLTGLLYLQGYRAEEIRRPA